MIRFRCSRFLFFAEHAGQPHSSYFAAAPVTIAGRKVRRDSESKYTDGERSLMVATSIVALHQCETMRIHLALIVHMLERRVIYGCSADVPEWQGARIMQSSSSWCP